MASKYILGYQCKECGHSVPAFGRSWFRRYFRSLPGICQSCGGIEGTGILLWRRVALRRRRVRRRGLLGRLGFTRVEYNPEPEHGERPVLGKELKTDGSGEVFDPSKGPVNKP